MDSVLTLIYFAGVTENFRFIMGLLIFFCILAFCSFAIMLAIASEVDFSDETLNSLCKFIKRGCVTVFVLIPITILFYIFAPSKTFLYASAGIKLAEATGGSEYVQGVSNEVKDLMGNINEYLKVQIEQAKGDEND